MSGDAPPADLASLPVEELVELVSRAWETDGYEVQRTDGREIDLIARGHGETVAIAVEPGDDGPVASAVVDDVVVDAYQYGANDTVLATGGTFADDAVDQAASEAVTLVDGDGLRDRLAG